MLKQLGISAILAVCLFAMAIVGCNREDPPPDKPIEIVKPPEKTPMEKLAGTYSLVESELVSGGEVDNPPVSGRLHLRPGGNGWLVSYEYEDGESDGSAGPTWSANATTISFMGSENEGGVEEYTLEGKFLILSTFDTRFAWIEKWRKD